MNDLARAEKVLTKARRSIPRGPNESLESNMDYPVLAGGLPVTRAEVIAANQEYRPGDTLGSEGYMLDAIKNRKGE
jgi:hypothetical protein